MNEASYKRLFEQSPFLIMEVDADTYEILSCNPAMAETLGGKPEAFTGRKITEILPPEIMQQRKSYGERALETGEIQHFEDTRNGRYFRNTFIPITSKDKRSVQTITVDVTDRVLAEENFRLLAESSGTGITVIQDGGIVYVNSTAARISGYSKEEMQSMGMEFMIARIHPDDRERVTQTYLNQAADLPHMLEHRRQIDPIEYRHIKKDGTTVWTVAHTSAIHFHGHPALLVIHTDITDHKKLESVLSINEERYRKAQRLGKVGNWEYNIQTTTFWGSEEAKRIYGFDPGSKEFSTEDVEGCIPEKERVHQALVDLVEGGEAYNLEFDIIANDTGERKTIASVAELERDEHGEPLKVIGVIQDITIRKKAEELLKKSESRRRQAQQLARVGYWDWFFSTNELIWSEETYKIFGCAPGVFKVTVESFEALIHPDDLGGFIAERENALKESRDVNIEHRIVRPDGTIRHVHEIAEIVRDAEGQIIRVSGVVQDITDRKEIEEQLSTALRQKDILMQEVNHRVKNNLMMVSSLITLKNDQLGDAVDLSDLLNQIDAFVTAHRNLRFSNRDTSINVREYLTGILENVLSYNVKTPVEIINTIEDIHIPSNTAVSLGLIVNELATNALKYGFTSAETPRFSIDLKKVDLGNRYTLTIEGTGKPFPSGVSLDNPDTLGLRLVSALVEQMDGSIQLKREPHPVFTVTFPLDEAQ